MRLLVFLLTISSLQLNSYCQIFKFSPKEVEQDYYVALTSLTEGPIHWLDKPEEKVHAIAFRIAISTSEIYSNLYIEKVTYEQEGCCKVIFQSRKLDLYEVYKKFGLSGEISEVRFNQWTGSNSCEIVIQGKRYKMTNLDNEKINIQPIEGG